MGYFVKRSLSKTGNATTKESAIAIKDGKEIYVMFLNVQMTAVE